ncbi:hypothetical protein U2P60_14375 [Brucella sp. H1_1004]|uniref:hypothetical protein n=1 Tax=Brucella sp. H1_1004 TaxID=3110109 RepID=UPI0039B3E57A
MAVFQSPEASGNIGAMLTDAKRGAHMVTKQNMANFGFATNISRKVKTLWLDEGNKRANCFLKRESTMLKPKQAGNYPDRDLDCQEAVSEGISDLIEQAALSGTSEADAAAAIADTGVPGIRDLIDDAVAAGWSAEETATAIKVVSAGMYRGYTGTEPDE